MKKLRFIFIIPLIFVIGNSYGQLWAENVSVNVTSTFYSTCTVWVGAEDIGNNTYSYGYFYNVPTNTNVNLTNPMYFPTIPRPSPPIPGNYVRMVMLATAGGLSGDGFGDWTSPDPNTWYFTGGLLRIDLDD